MVPSSTSFLMKASIILQKTTQSLSTTLALVSQRLPFIPHFAPLLSSPASLRIATPLLTSFAGTHTLTGQTTQILTANDSTNPLNLEVGQEFSWEFDSARYDTKSSTVAGLPTGANYTFGYDFEFGEQIASLARGGTINGAITVPGTYQVTIVGYRFANERGNQTPPYTLTINVTNPEPASNEELFAMWREQNWIGLDASNNAVSGPNADPDDDDIPNLLEFYLALDPNEAVRIENTQGYFFGTTSDNGGSIVWQIGYLGSDTVTIEETIDPSNEESWTEVPAAQIELTPNSLRLEAPIASGPAKFFRLRATF